ncbi:hypothetical protein EVAR_21707_1 [Eumeta japonica]|uniref:Uncharacterized protein n=1 Tax=Eumeta variegata TaxID=151549 RepID=A0A4C1W655_EUMVA|nr:hypothetical protein EVAR_21707_1 [Eumeta japonica]
MRLAHPVVIVGDVGRVQFVHVVTGRYHTSGALGRNVCDVLSHNETCGGANCRDTCQLADIESDLGITKMFKTVLAYLTIQAQIKFLSGAYPRPAAITFSSKTRPGGGGCCGRPAGRLSEICPKPEFFLLKYLMDPKRLEYGPVFCSR